MRIHKFETSSGTYQLALERGIKTDDYGKWQVVYAFFNPARRQIFAGHEYYPGASLDPTGLDAAKDLLGFLTLRPGDTDKEYFADYTPEQMAFALSDACEELQLYALED